MVLTLFVAVPTIYYVFFSAIEIVCTSMIVWYAWKWLNPDVIPVAVKIGAEVNQTSFSRSKPTEIPAIIISISAKMPRQAERY